MIMSKVGRPTELDETMFTEIRGLVLSGKNMKETAKTLGVSYSTMANWVSTNYRNFGDIWLSYEQERKLKKAEARIEKLLDSEDEKIALQASTFLMETLGKGRGYSKRQEITGRNGRDLDVEPMSEEEAEKLYALIA